jgi:hypothetical protein
MLLTESSNLYRQASRNYKLKSTNIYPRFARSFSYGINDSSGDWIYH